MSKVVLSAPITVNPAQAPSVNIRSYLIDPDGVFIISRVELLDANGDVIEVVNVRIANNGVTNFITAREPQLRALTLAKLGATEA